MKSFYILDALAYLYRSHYGIAEMHREDGSETHALFGFIRCIVKLQKERKIDSFVIAFDGPNNKKRRKEIYSDYKAHRSPMPDALVRQLQWAKEFCKLAAIPLLEVPYVEADDVIAELALWAEKKGYEVFICSKDKDFYQILSPQIHVLDTFKGNALIDEAWVQEKFGIPASSFGDYLSIVGDSADNIPGVAGLGPKAACSLLEGGKNIEQILDTIDTIPQPRYQKLLMEQKQKLLMSQKLVALQTDLGLPQEESFFQQKEAQAQLKDFLKSMSFHSLLSHWKFTKSSSLQIPPLQERSTEDLENLFASIAKNKIPYALYPLLAEGHFLEAPLIALGIATETERFFISDSLLSLPSFQTLLLSQAPLYSDRAKDLLHLLDRYGLEAKIAGDLSLISYLLEAQSHSHSLESLSQQHLQIDIPPLQQATDSASLSAFVILSLHKILFSSLQKENLEDLYISLELPLLRLLQRMEKRGIHLDLDILKALSQTLEAKISERRTNILTLAGKDFNPLSPLQLGKILFEDLGLTSKKKTKRGYATDAQSLSAIQDQHPIIDEVLAFRQLYKLYSTYTESLPQYLFPKTKRIHCHFEQTVAATGRLSSSSPNLQNIPIKTAEGRLIRSAFRPQKPFTHFLSADYSQIELRILAHISEDTALLKAFREGGDIHRHTASNVFSIPSEEISQEQRKKAKIVNFGIIYGQGPLGLSRELKISLKEAKAFIEAYFLSYPGVRAYIEDQKQRITTDPYVESMFGRRRYIPSAHSKQAAALRSAERLAVNMPIQGAAADIMKKALLAVSDLLETNKFRSQMVLNIHDEILFECLEEELPALQKLLPSCMSGVASLKVPLLINLSVGKNWSEC